MNIEITIRDFPQTHMNGLMYAAAANGVSRDPEAVLRWALFQFANMVERGLVYHCSAPSPAPASAGSES